MLTELEQEYIELIVQGYTNFQIKQKMQITDSLLKSISESIYKKLNVCNRVQATFKYLKLLHKYD